MAPVKGITDHIYHKAFESFFKGFDVFYTPFICAQGPNIPKISYIEEALQRDIKTKVVPQILGNCPKNIIAMAKGFLAAKSDMININMGCPIYGVVKKTKGSGLLDNTQKAEKFITECTGLKPEKLKISIKIRLGYAQKDSLFKLLPVINRSEIEEIILHPRLGIQIYSGSPDLEKYEKFYFSCSHKKVYNGDIKSVQDFLAIKKRFPDTHAFMIGRGALSNPFLPSLIKGLPPVDPKQARIKIKEFHYHLLHEYQKQIKTPGGLLSRMKAHWFYLSCTFKKGPCILGKIQRINCMDEYARCVEKIFDNTEYH
jgi:tRNA-dihydrouridine synthase